MKNEMVRLAGEYEQGEMFGRPIFDEEVMHFLYDLSEEIKKNPGTKHRKDCAAFAFWCRQKHLESWKKHEKNRMGWGMAFHIAPSNIPTLFAYSMVYGLLAGNGNVIRISSRVVDESKPLCHVIDQVLKQYPYINQNTRIFTCERTSAWMKQYAKECDVRVIWGGNQAIESIKKYPVQPGVMELTFADRISIAVMDTNWMREQSQNTLRHLSYQFYQDTFAMDQNACSSPSVLVWVGDDEKEVKEKWWNLCKETAREYELAPWKVSKKYEELCQMVMKSENVDKVQHDNNYIYVVDLKECPKNLEDYHARFGTFYQCHISNLEELMPCIGRKVQTILYLGDIAEEIKEAVIASKAKGGDRIVPMGQALTLESVWDGKDMIQTLSRKIVVTTERRN